MFLKHVEKLYDEHKYVTFQFSTGKQRTRQQNRALHLYLRQLSAALNEGGLDMRKVLKHSVAIPWNEALAKEFLWCPIQKALTGKTSTTQPDRKDYTIIYETLNRLTAEKFSISLPFPNSEDL